jgi:hypothetical protein
MHVFDIEDATGDLIDVIPLCSDSCHRDYAGNEYAGWNGAYESEFTTYCAQCGVVIPGEDACEHQFANIVVNRFLSDEGEKCEHGNWIQVPAANLERTP